MDEDGAGPVDSLAVFEGGARANGTTILARGGPFALALLEEEHEVAKLAGSSSMG